MKKTISLFMALILIFKGFYTHAYNITDVDMTYNDETKNESFYEYLEKSSYRFIELAPFDIKALGRYHDVSMEELHQYQETIYFNAIAPRINLTYRQIASQRLEQIGLSQSFLDTFSDEDIRIVATAEMAFVSNNFHAEEIVGDDSYLVPISRSEFLRRNEIYANESITEEMLSEIILLDPYSEHLDISPH